MKLSKYKKIIKSPDFRTFLFTLTGVVFGALLTIAIYPKQKDIDQQYWLKQQEIISKQNNITNKIKFLDDYIDTITTFRLCAIKANANEMGDIYVPSNASCYLQNSYKTYIKTLEAGFYFDVNDFQSIASLSANTWKFDEVLQYLSQNPEDVKPLFDNNYAENDDLLRQVIVDLTNSINKDIEDYKKITKGNK